MPETHFDFVFAAYAVTFGVLLVTVFVAVRQRRTARHVLDGAKGGKA